MPIGDVLPASKIEAETVEATNMLRWVMRDGQPVLQQGWRVTIYGEWCRCIGVRADWRDVPVEKEA